MWVGTCMDRTRNVAQFEGASKHPARCFPYHIHTCPAGRPQVCLASTLVSSGPVRLANGVRSELLSKPMNDSTVLRSLNRLVCLTASLAVGLTLPSASAVQFTLGEVKGSF